MPKFKEYNQGQSMLLPYNIKDWIPNDHVCMIIDKMVDDIDISSVESGYSANGCPAYNPVMMIKVLFYAYNQGIRSSRKIEKMCVENVIMRYLSANQFPDHGTISSFRKNNLNSLEKLFAKIVFLCDGLDMIDVSDISVDGSIFKASAARNNSLRKDDIERITKNIRGMLEEAERIDEEEDRLYNDKEKKKRGYQEIPEKYRDKEALDKKLKELNEKLDRMEEAGIAIDAKQEKVKNQNYETRNLMKNRAHNITDPDANIMKMKGGKIYKPAYNGQIATSNQVILAYDITDDPTDFNSLIPMIEKTEENTKTVVKTVKADAGYYSKDNMEKIEAKKINAYIPDQMKNKEEKEKMNNEILKYGKRNFKYNAAKNEFVCPEGKQMKLEGKIKNRIKGKLDKNYHVYVCTDCQDCEARGECINGKRNKKLKIDWQAEKYKTEMRQKLNTKEGKSKYLERMNEVEPPFSNITINHNARNFLCRGRPTVKVEFGLSCIAHNLTKIANWVKNDEKRLKQLAVLTNSTPIS